MSDTISSKILEILGKHVGDDITPEQVTADAPLEDLGVDSMAVVEIIFDIEEEFDITVPDPGEIEGVDTEFRTGQDVINAIQALLTDKDA